MSSKSDNSEVAPQKPKQAGIGGDIEIPAEQANAFFFMDSDEEAKTYGATTQSSMALTGTILKGASKQKVRTLFLFGVFLLITNTFNKLGCSEQTDRRFQDQGARLHIDIHQRDEEESDRVGCPWNPANC